MKITKGECNVYQSGNKRLSVRASENNGTIEICSVNDPGFLENKSSDQVAKANANLICEAFNTYNETGFSPRQLAEQNKKLMKALEGMLPNYNEYVPVDEELGRPYQTALKAINSNLKTWRKEN